MDFISLWKVGSVILAGAFGVLGLLKSYKDKETGRITKWGRISLIGILLSTALGVAAQLKEQSKQQKVSEDRAKETLALAQKTDQTVRDLQRTLTFLDSPTVTLRFQVNCQVRLYGPFCQVVAKRQARGLHLEKDYADVWERFPIVPSMWFVIYVFKHQDGTGGVTEAEERDPDLAWIVQTKFVHSINGWAPEPNSMEIQAYSEGPTYLGVWASPITLFNKSMPSILDFEQADIVIAPYWGYKTEIRDQYIQ
jgi:hypothetical protein